MKILIVIPMLLMFGSCSDENENAAPPVLIRKEQIQGQWRSVYMKVVMETYKNSDSTKVFVVNDGEWEQKMGIKPIRTFYWYGGTYNSEHYNLNDSLFYNPAGKWELRYDSLIMTDTFPKPGLQYRYKLTVHGNMAEFTGLEDLDGDGKADDHYYGLQRKFR